MFVVELLCAAVPAVLVAVLLLLGLRGLFFACVCKTVAAFRI